MRRPTTALIAIFLAAAPGLLWLPRERVALSEAAGPPARGAGPPSERTLEAAPELTSASVLDVDPGWREIVDSLPN